MRIIILGSNQVSETLAENLASEENDIVLIDTDGKKLAELQNRFDIKTVVGLGSYPDILEQAQAGDTEMIIAVSSNDEVNMLACQIAYSLFHIPLKIARVRAKNYLANTDLFNNESLPIDVIISPEALVTDQIKQMIDYPGALQVSDFSQGAVRIVNVKPYYGGELVGKTISVARKRLRELHSSLIAIFRGKRFISLTDKTLIEVGDEIFCISSHKDIHTMINLFRRSEKQHKSIMIAGGGNIGSRLASCLESQYRVKVLEVSQEISERISLELDKTIVITGDASDKELLESECIDEIDVFCAMTNDDEANIMSCLQAKQLGAKYVIALVTKTAYIDIIEDSKIDIVVSPQQATTSSILTYIRRGDIATVHSFRRGEAEAIEMVAHGDENTSKVVGRKSTDIMFKEGACLSAIIRDNKMYIPSDDIFIESGDHVIMFISNKKRVQDIEKLFQVKVGFI